jgi:WXXGXW repeat (2 copies)
MKPLFVILQIGGVALKKILLTVVFGIGLGIVPASAEEVVVRVRPPRAVVEHRVVAPSGRHVWIAGYHRWDGNAYVWTPGRWELPPREHVVWVAPRWRHRHDGWVFVEGRWR